MNDPVNYNDSTGEIANILVGAGFGGFYGAGKAVEELRGSVARSIGDQRRSKFHILTDEEIAGLRKDIEALDADMSIFRFSEGHQTGFMDSKELLEKESKIVFNAAEEYERKGEIEQRCPRCDGRLTYYRAGNSFSISCENQCGFVYNFRGL